MLHLYVGGHKTRNMDRGQRYIEKHKKLGTRDIEHYLENLGGI